MSAEALDSARDSLRIRVVRAAVGSATETLRGPACPRTGGNGARGDCDGLQDRASWIPLAVDFNQDGATVTETVTSTFAALPNFAWTFESGTISIDGSHTLARSCQRVRAPSDGGPSRDCRLSAAPVIAFALDPPRVSCRALTPTRGVPCGHRRP